MTVINPVAAEIITINGKVKLVSHYSLSPHTNYQVQTGDTSASGWANWYAIPTGANPLETATYANVLEGQNVRVITA